MSAETGILIITLIGAIGTGVNVYLTLTIANSTLKLKLWATENFVHKEEFNRFTIWKYRDKQSLPGTSHASN